MATGDERAVWVDKSTGEITGVTRDWLDETYAEPVTEALADKADLTDGRVPEAQLPTNLSAESLNSTFDTHISVKRFGAIGDGVADDTDALQAALASGEDIYFPPGTYLTAETLVQGDANVDLATGAVVKASAVMDTLWQIGTDSVVANRKRTRGGVFHANSLAVLAVWQRNFAYHEFSGAKILSPTQDFMVSGDFDLATHPYEPVIRDVVMHRPSSQSVPAGSYGLYVKNATDGHYDNIVIVGANIGVRADAGGGQFSKVHPWGFSGKLPKWNFYDTAVGGTGTGNTYIACIADSPTEYGWKISQQGARLIGCSVFLNEWAPDNVVSGIRVETGATFYAYGTSFVGQVSNRIANDVSGDITGSVLHGSRRLNVVNSKGDANYLDTKVQGDSATLWAVRKADGTAKVIVNTSSATNLLGFANGGFVTGYSDGLTTPVWRLNGTSGAIIPGTTAGLGAAIYSGSAAPDDSMGTNGDIYLRKGSAGDPMIYHRVSGVWLSVNTPADVVNTIDPTVPLSPVVWGTANQARYLRVRGSGVISKIGFEVTTQSGNISVAAYSGSGSGRTRVPGTRLATSGTVSCPAIGYAEVALGSTITVQDGDFLAMGCDNTTAAFRGISGGDPATIVGGVMYRQGTAHPLPDPAASLTATQFRVPMLIGIA